MSLSKIDGSVKLHFSEELIVFGVSRYVVSERICHAITVTVTGLAFVAAICIVIGWTIHDAHIIVPKLAETGSAIGTNILASKTILAALLACHQVSE